MNSGPPRGPRRQRRRERADRTALPPRHRSEERAHDGERAADRPGHPFQQPRRHRHPLVRRTGAAGGGRAGALYFCTGPGEQKAKNLAHNPHCTLTTGANTLREGLDLVVEGEAAAVRDDAVLRRVAEAYVTKYGEEWTFEVRDGSFHHEGGQALVYEVAPATAFGFRKGVYGQTRWGF
ncbi:pyridoxamine 5'-phosphate oxidase family protein [Streptomyces coffeae]|uniref:pyridoxamine 5'-phosphate oxidase family protein n=1 Tax=Streptomyces coffeae TaxID=621382 RepID=UPI0035566501